MLNLSPTVGYMQNFTQMFVCYLCFMSANVHNLFCFKFRANDTTYAKQNGGKYDFIVEKYKALPITKQFWMDLFKEAKLWGIVLYEQVYIHLKYKISKLEYIILL